MKFHALIPKTESSEVQEKACFDAAFQAHWRPVYRVLYRLVGERAEAEDVAIEVFWRLHRKMRTSGACEVPRAWLYRVAINLGLNSLRARRRRKQHQDAAGQQLYNGDVESPLDEAERAEKRRLVHTVLSRLKPRAARLLILRYSGFSYAELAETLMLSPGSVGTLLARAEREFEREFKAVAANSRP